MSPAAYKVTYSDELTYYERQQEAYQMELEADIVNQEREKIHGIELRAQMKILLQLDALAEESGQTMLEAWIDLKIELLQKIKKLKA